MALRELATTPLPGGSTTLGRAAGLNVTEIADALRSAVRRTLGPRPRPFELPVRIAGVETVAG